MPRFWITKNDNETINIWTLKPKREKSAVVENVHYWYVRGSDGFWLDEYQAETLIGNEIPTDRAIEISVEVIGEDE